MDYWNTDKELFSIAKGELFTALVGDVLDKMGYFHQFLPPGLKPLREDMVMIGRAMPVLEADLSSPDAENFKNSVLQKPFGMMFEALDDLKEDEVYICTGSSLPYALWGGLMTTRALKLNAAGAVLDGFSRDTNEILRLNFPTFSMGTYAQDQGPRGKVLDFRIPIKWGEIMINPGYIIFGDRDGVVVVPKEAEAEAYSSAIEKGRREKLIHKSLQEGMTTVDAFARFGIM